MSRRFASFAASLSVSLAVVLALLLGLQSHPTAATTQLPANLAHKLPQNPARNLEAGMAA